MIFSTTKYEIKKLPDRLQNRSIGSRIYVHNLEQIIVHMIKSEQTPMTITKLNENVINPLELHKSFLHKQLI